MAVFTTNLGKLGQTFVARLVMRVLSIKTGTRRIMRLDELSLKYVLNDILRKVARLDAWVRLVPVFILDTHNPDELQNICPSSSRQIMRP